MSIKQTFRSLRANPPTGGGAKQSPGDKHSKDCFGKKRLAMTEKKCSIYDLLQYNTIRRLANGVCW